MIEDLQEQGSSHPWVEHGQQGVHFGGAVRGGKACGDDRKLSQIQARLPLRRGQGKPGANPNRARIGPLSTASAVRKGVAASQKPDPIAVARANWERAGWRDVSQGMVAVTSVMRAHQILLARVETALRPYDLSFSRFELLRLLAFSRTGALPITKASDRLQVHVTSVTHAIRRLEADGPVQRVPHPTDGRTTLVQITDLGRSTVEDATVTLNEQVFADIGISTDESQALVSSIETLRRNAGDF